MRRHLLHRDALVAPVQIAIHGDRLVVALDEICNSANGPLAFLVLGKRKMASMEPKELTIED